MSPDCRRVVIAGLGPVTPSNLHEPNGGHDVDYVTDSEPQHEVRLALMSSFGLGGSQTVCPLAGATELP